MFQRILIPTDGSACSVAARDHALDLAEKVGGSVTFVHVLEHKYLPTSDPKMARQTETHNHQNQHYATDVLNRARDIARGRGVDATVVWEADDHPHDVILDLAKEHDLIVMGSHGRRGLGRIMFGSTSQRVLNRARCPVLIIGCRDGKKNRNGKQKNGKK